MNRTTLCADAFEAVPGNPYRGFLTSASDVDFFKVYVAEPYKALNLRLAHPTQIYELALYYGCPESGGWARNIGWAHNIGEVTASYNVGSEVGWYYVKISGYAGTYDQATPYQFEASLTDTTAAPRRAARPRPRSQPASPTRAR